MEHRKQDRGDQARAVLLGEVLGLGEVWMVARARRYGPVPFSAGLVAVVAVYVGIPVAMPTAGSPGWSTPRCSGRTRRMHVSRTPNGLLLPHLVAHAAARNGVTVLRYPPKRRDPRAVGAAVG